ncbi:hypothetical protein GPEL0_01r0025 [Geoanaerobacter pelophilus]|uniref:Uncharacterized protein n=1 Tax=Geoanaerobacter pelophilus TaxID=60036 RepID=A0ABQ0MDP5_9BACT|nr:hypothetical protein GPEL0_01r0025 [Geoanaerobacter pelophilus]
MLQPGKHGKPPLASILPLPLREGIQKIKKIPIARIFFL